MFILN